ncbi:MAG: phage holin family protein [Candidatus Harrisonbacteria bacterium]|nr:phage holin family protein [Candidatus Harrisonbacteria bacterium]MBI2604047.1 phage holin family protein [Candidatus Harrisonbacteria bacterium]MBI3114728.1 phage holin family protein [Candidatus Harrisonbacteria bacterium]
MLFLLNVFSYFIGNAAGLVVASYILPDFRLTMTAPALLTVTLLLMLGNIFIRPIMKFIFNFVVILTLGLFTIVINAIILAAIDFFSPYLMITSIVALLEGTVILSVVNMIVGGGIRFFARETAPDA